LGLHLRSFVTTTKPQPSLNHNLKSVPLVLTRNSSQLSPGLSDPVFGKTSAEFQNHTKSGRLEPVAACHCAKNRDDRDTQQYSVKDLHSGKVCGGLDRCHHAAVEKQRLNHEKHRGEHGP
jgi:hypothetical protein